MTTELTLLAALAIGLAGSPHCLGMCGGIAGSLGTATQTGIHGRWRYALCYNLGRLGSYALLGALFALLLSLPGLALARPEWGWLLRAATGLVLLAIAAYLLFDWSGIRRIEVVGSRVWRLIGPHARRLLPVRTASGALALGALWGWLPCGLVYTVLLTAAISGDPAAGAGIMLAFGLGTLPAMMGITLFGQALRGWQRSTSARRVLGAMLLLFALWTIASPLAHVSSGDDGHTPQQEGHGH